MPDTNDNDIDALLRWMACDFGDDDKWLLAVTALVAERDALRERVAELGTSVSKLAILNDQLLEQPPAASDLRERDETLIRWMNQVTVMLCHSMTHSHDEKKELVNRCHAAIAAIRKGATDGK